MSFLYQIPLAFGLFESGATAPGLGEHARPRAFRPAPRGAARKECGRWPVETNPLGREAHPTAPEAGALVRTHIYEINQ